MRRLFIVVAFAFAALVAAAPALAAADTFRFRASGTGVGASFSNFSWDEEGEIQPGEYFYTDVWASSEIYAEDGGSYEDSGVCVFHETFTIDESGEWTEGAWFEACAGGADLKTSPRLTDASVVASLPVEQCLEYDPEWEDCIELVELGTIEVDLSVLGEGPISRNHDAFSGGSAGNYQYSFHGTGADRDATASGSVDLVADGSVTDLTGGLAGDGYLYRSTGGGIDISISHGGL